MPRSYPAPIFHNSAAMSPPSVLIRYCRERSAPYMDVTIFSFTVTRHAALPRLRYAELCRAPPPTAPDMPACAIVAGFRASPEPACR